MDTTIARDALALGRLIPRHAKYRPRHAAVIAPAGDREIRLDWRELDDYVNRWANALARLGVVRGDRVATVLPNAIELVAGYWACFALGAAAVPLSMLLNPSGIGNNEVLPASRSNCTSPPSPATRLVTCPSSQLVTATG